MIPIGHQIYLKRLERHLTQAEFAVIAGIAQPNLSNIEKGKQDVTVSTLRKIAAALNVHPGTFFSDFDDAPKSSSSRRKIEHIAKQVAAKTSSPEPHQDAVVRLYQNVLPYKGRVRARELQRSWLELRKRFNSQEINSVHERVEEHKRRRP